jgi:N-acetylglucosaminyldiphosphoundecaprenol N-acetyl-beta-D-mannosaminyltransferase
MVLNDGIGLDVYALLAGVRFNQNFNGTDLIPRLFAQTTPEKELRVFLYGAEKGRAAKAAKNIEARYPNVRVVGTLDGFARGESVIEAINEACADVLLVGMGNPIQERWIDENKDLLDVGIVAGVGALIDFLSGEVVRAPSWIRAMRLEWLYRLAREPKRLFKRYVMGNPAFLARSVAYLGLGVAPKEVPF